MSGSMSGDWKRGPINGLPRQSSTLLNPWNTRQATENPRVGASIPSLATVLTLYLSEIWRQLCHADPGLAPGSCHRSGPPKCGMNYPRHIV
jgi:hypothetical protein